MTSKYLYNHCTKKGKAQLFVFFVLFLVLGCSNNQQRVFDERTPVLDGIIEKTSHFVKTDPLYALSYVDSCLANKKLTVPEKIKVLGNKCQAYLFYLNDTASANIYADSMLIFSETNHPNEYPTQYAYSYYSKGDVLFKEKKYSDAYQYYYKARSIAKADFNPCTLGEYSHRIAMVFYRQGRYKEATENFQKSFAQTNTCVMDFGKYFRLQEELCNIALSFHEAGNNDSALFYYEKTLQFIDEHKAQFDFRKTWHEMAKGVIYGNKGQVFKDKGNNDEAEKLFRKSIAINLQKGNDITDAQLTYLKLADLFYKENKIDSMGLALKTIKGSLDSVNNKEAEIEWNRLMSQYYNKKQQPAEAYKYLLVFTEKNDSTQKANKILNTIDASQQVKMLEKQHDIDTLTQENSANKGYLIITVTIGLIFILTGLLIFYYWKQSKKNVSLLTQLNDKINNQKIELEGTLAALEEKNTEKDRILKVVAHDLRTPVASIFMLADLMLEEKNDEQRNEMIQLTKIASENSLSLISEILESTIVANSTLLKEKVCINVLINECADLLKLKAKEKNQTITVHLLPEDILMKLNKEKIKRVINNLVTNAIKFSNKDGNIRIKATSKNNTVRISIKDQGIGIPDNMKSKVFDVFTDARRDGTSGEKPFGLGLSICRQIIEAHGGNIWFKTELGKGSTFYIELKNE